MPQPFSVLFRRWRQALALRREVRVAEEQYALVSAGWVEYFDATGDLPEGFEDAQARCLSARCRLLERAAARWDVELPESDWMSPDPKWQFHDEHGSYLTSSEQEKAWKLIRKARRESVDWWTQLTVRLVTLLASLGALVWGVRR